MKKIDFDFITDKDITDNAGLSHITIYRHFKSTDEIIKYYLDSITDEYINTSKISYNPDNFNGYIAKLFTHLERNKDIGILLYKANMIHYLKDEFDRIFLAKGTNKTENIIMPLYLVAYIIFTIFGLKIIVKKRQMNLQICLKIFIY